MIIAVIGYANAGKDTVADYISKHYGYTKFVFSDVITEQITLRGMENTKENQSILGVALRQEYHDNSIIAKLLARKMGTSHNAVLSGMRSPEELTVLREYGTVKVLYVEASLSQRYAQRRERNLTIEDVRNRDERDKTGMGLGRLIEEKYYDYKVTNNGSKEFLFSQVDTILRQLQ